MSVDCRVISIGTLASHPLWNESPEVRTGHATTSLVVTDDASILIDPSLPGQAVLARLSERTTIRPDEITHVFLTSADALHRRGLAAFHNAAWLVHDVELESAKETLARHVRDAEDSGDDELRTWLDDESAMLQRCAAAPDTIVRGVDLFPLPGATPGSCGLLLPLPRATLLICGDAIPTLEHLQQGKVLPDCFNIEQAMESFTEAVEIADLLIPGRDNITLNPLRRPVGM